MRNPRRSANVAIIIALGLAFGVFSLSIIATNQAHLEREIRAAIGADMDVIPLDPKADLTANLSSIPGVAGVTKIQSLTIPAGYSATAYALDPDSYFGVARPEGWEFADGNVAHGHDVLAQDGQILVSQALFAHQALEIGDRIALFADVYNPNGTIRRTVQENVTIGGVVLFLPGVVNSQFGAAFYGVDQWAYYASTRTLQPFLDPTVGNLSTVSRYLLDLAPGVNWRKVKAAVAANPGTAEAV